MSEWRFQTIFSPCRTWRYTLARPFGDLFGQAGFVNFLCYNPSTADEDHNDATVRRCIEFARGWGAGGCMVTNLFAFRGTDPDCLLQAPDPIGPENDWYILGTARLAQQVIVAWGALGVRTRLHGRKDAVLDLLRSNSIQTYCLGRTKEGDPRHPLFLRGDTKPQLFI